MMRIFKDPRLLLPACALGLIWAGATHPPAAARDGPDRPPGASRAIDYAADVRPILEATLLRLPRAEEAEGRPAARREGGGLPGRQRRRRGHPARQRCRERARPVASRAVDPEERMPPEGEPADPRAGRRPPGLDRPGGELAGGSGGRVGEGPGSLGLPAARPPGRAAGPDRRLGAEPDRPLRPRPAGGGGAGAVARGRPGHAAPPAQPRPDRPAADARGGRRLPRRHARRRLREGWSTGCWPRRTTASAGAGTGSTPPATPTPTATRRTSRATSGSTATGSSTPSTATCPTTSSSSSRSPATCCPSATQDQVVATGLPAQLDDQRGRRRRSRAVPHGGDVRPHGRHRQGRPRPDHPVRPVPQPQVRPAHAGRVLPAVRLPEQRPRGRTSPSTRPTSR